MSTSELPDGLSLTFAGATARVTLPAFEQIDAQAYEPVLSQRHADRIADAVDEHVKSRRRAGTPVAPLEVRFSGDARYTQATLRKFRARLSVTLIEHGHEATIDDQLSAP